MRNNLATIMKQMWCNHEFHPVRWHWTHGPYGNDFGSIEAEWKCEKCGKIEYRYPERGSFEESLYVQYKSNIQQ